MTYAQFLLAFLAPVVTLAVGLLIFRIRRCRRKGRRLLPNSAPALIALLLGVALFYTTPWDSWLIGHAVWGYPPGSVMGTLFRVPYEEYLFMIGMTLFTSCWALTVSVGRVPQATPTPAWGLRWSAPRRILATAGWLTVAGAGAAAAAMAPKALYLGSQLAWFGVPLAVQAACGADLLSESRRLRLLGLATTIPLWVADAVAIKAGAWHVSSSYTVGVALSGLPLEEATFFLLVNLLIVNALVLYLDPRMRARLRGGAGGVRQIRFLARTETR
jgi:lycopene beta-cyclase